MWPTGFTAPTSGVAYVQPFPDASGNLSESSGSAYPIAVPRIDPGATSGTNGNQYIVPYSAQLFYAALSGIQAEYAARGATEPEFHAFYDKDKTSYDVLTSWSGLLSAPLENFHMVVEEAQNAISGLVCMDGWNDDMDDYQRRVFDYRMLMSGVPSVNRLSNNVSYYNVSSGSMVTINPLDRARSGLFPINVEDAKNLHSQWGVAADGSRTYGTDEFGASGVAAGDQSERDPEFQQHAFVGHFDWLVQSLMWRPPIVESWSSGTYTEPKSFINHDRGQEFAAVGMIDDSDDLLVSTAFHYLYGTSISPTIGAAQPLAHSSAASPVYSSYANPSVSYLDDTVEEFGDLGNWHVGRPQLDRMMTTVSEVGGISTYQFPSGPGVGGDLDYYHLKPFFTNGDREGYDPYEEHTVHVSGGMLISKVKDFIKTIRFHSQEYVPPNTFSCGSGAQAPGDQEYVEIYRQCHSIRHGEEASVDYGPEVASQYHDYCAPFNQPSTLLAGDYNEEHTVGTEVYQSAISWVAPEASGRWGVVEDDFSGVGNSLKYPIGSGSEIVIDVDVDSHAAMSGHSMLQGRSDFVGLHVCVQSNKHLPSIVYDTTEYSHGKPDMWVGEMVTINAIDEIIQGQGGEYVVRHAGNPAYGKLAYFNNKNSNDPASDTQPFTASGQLKSTHGIIRNTPSLIQSYWTDQGFLWPRSNAGSYNGAIPYLGYLNGQKKVFYGDVPITRRRGENLIYNGSTDTYWHNSVLPSVNWNYPSGSMFTTLKISDYAPASGNRYTLPLWDKFEGDMARLRTGFLAGYIDDNSSEPWRKTTISGKNWSNCVDGADPMFGYQEDIGGAYIDALTLLDIIKSGPGSYLPASGAGYQVHSVRLKFPAILGPSGVL